jgi:hypothetical protein
MQLHYPRYTKLDYEAMLEWRDVDDKRRFAMGVFSSATTSTDGASYTLVGSCHSDQRLKQSNITCPAMVVHVQIPMLPSPKRYL